MRSDLFQRKLDKALLTDFFGSVRNIELLDISTGRRSKPKVKKEKPRQEGMTVEVEEEEEEEEEEEQEEMGYATVRDMAERSARPVLDVPSVVGDTAVVSGRASLL